MIEQYLSNKNENATVAKSENFSELNKAYDFRSGHDFIQADKDWIS
jgi:hypothetical protein